MAVAVNGQLANLEHGTMSQPEIEALLFGNGNGPVILYFAEANKNLQVLWKEFFDNLDTISVWGSCPMKRRLYDALHNLTRLVGKPTEKTSQTRSPSQPALPKERVAKHPMASKAISSGSACIVSLASLPRKSVARLISSGFKNKLV